MSQHSERARTWRQLVEQLGAEYAGLDEREEVWIRRRCARIAELQRQLDELFRKGDGEGQCRDCRGDCCALGHNHMTLANLLLLLDRGDKIPLLDFAATCPLLGSAGCVLAAEQRPYNCISFLCDRIEDRLTADEVERFYTLERELRGCYQAFAARYAGGGMSGMLLAARRLQGRPLLQRIDRDPSS